MSLTPLFTLDGRINPYPFYADLHTQGPVCRVVPGERNYDFVVHGYDVAGKVLRDPVFKVMDSTKMSFELTWEEHPTQAIFMNSVMFANEPRHTRMRRTFNQVFTARRVSGLEPAIVKITDDSLNRMSDPRVVGCWSCSPRRTGTRAASPIRTRSIRAGGTTQTLSFGSGAHYCLGAALARLEGQPGTGPRSATGRVLGGRLVPRWPACSSVASAPH